MTARIARSRREFVAGSGALLGAFAAGSAPVRAQARQLRLSIFGGVDAWPIYVLHDKGFLHDYALTITPMSGSTLQAQRLMAGDDQIALMAMDNVVAYDEGLGDPSVQGNIDFAAFMGLGPGFLRLLVRPEIASYDQMRGKTFAVDALGTGFTLVLRRMLEKNGVAPGTYSLIALGSTQKRFDGMVAGQCVGAVVGTPFDILGARKYGFRILGSANDVLGHYQATAFAARRSWAAENRAAILAFVAAYRQATAWLFDPVNRAEAIVILARSADLAPDLVTQIAPAVLGSPQSFSRTGAFDLAGVQTVLELRSSYTTPKKTFGAPAKYIDTSYLST